ncbi:UNVERIFIED_CONTAM: hypothetical protein Slati_2586800 [Sesamum latifolium]|uniref:C2HC zinc finger plants domain-containing protein n=1 Tax=Sesamum latifolium TaxID=2727402 RepID=A0AAW2VWL7_9LAMI
MNSTDAEMIEAEAPALPQALGLNNGSGDLVGNLLAMARQLVDQGKPSQALHAFAVLTFICATAVTTLVVMAMKIQGGDEAVAQALNRAWELYRNKIQASSAADELASLFAKCAIDEAMPSRTEPPPHNMDTLFSQPDAQANSILAETGRKQILLDAFSDGSSFICLQCGGLVSNHRKEEHCAFWCCKI